MYGCSRYSWHRSPCVCTSSYKRRLGFTKLPPPGTRRASAQERARTPAPRTRPHASTTHAPANTNTNTNTKYTCDTGQTARQHHARAHTPAPRTTSKRPRTRPHASTTHAPGAPTTAHRRAPLHGRRDTLAARCRADRGRRVHHARWWRRERAGRRSRTNGKYGDSHCDSDSDSDSDCRSVCGQQQLLLLTRYEVTHNSHKVTVTVTVDFCDRHRGAAPCCTHLRVEVLAACTTCS